MGRAEHRTHDLELARVPEPQARQERRARQQERKERGDEGRQEGRDRAAADSVTGAGASHQPRPRLTTRG